MTSVPDDQSASVPQTVPMGTGGPEACPPPLRCRDVAAALETSAESWKLTGSRLGTHGWCWGDGPALYWLNPLGGSARLFALAAWLLREEYRSVLIDWDAAPIGNAGRLDLFAEELLRVADMLGDSDVSLYAGSFGAAVAVRAMRQRPSLAQQLVLQGVAVRRRLSVGEWLLARVGRYSRRRWSDVPYFAQLQTVNHRRWFPPLDADRWNWFLETTSQIPAALLAAQALALNGADLREDLSAVSCPVLLVSPEGAGPRAHRAQRTVGEQLTQGYSTWLHTTGCHPYLTHPHRLVKLVRQFVADPAAFDPATTEPSSAGMSAR